MRGFCPGLERVEPLNRVLVAIIVGHIVRKLPRVNEPRLGAECGRDVDDPFALLERLLPFGFVLDEKADAADYRMRFKTGILASLAKLLNLGVRAGRR